MNKCIDGDNEKGLLCPIMHFSLKTHKDNAASQAYWQNPIQSFSHSLCIIYNTQCCNRLLCTYLLLLSASACVGKFMFLIGHIDIPTRPIKLSRPTTRKGKVCVLRHMEERRTQKTEGRNVAASQKVNLTIGEIWLKCQELLVMLSDPEPSHR